MAEYVILLCRVFNTRRSQKQKKERKTIETLGAEMLAPEMEAFRCMARMANESLSR